MLRGIGRSLGPLGANGVLPDPELLLFDGNAASSGANDNWQQTQQAEIEALHLAPNDDREAALVTSLPRGNYTAVLCNKDGTTGVESYNGAATRESTLRAGATLTSFFGAAASIANESQPEQL